MFEDTKDVNNDRLQRNLKIEERKQTQNSGTPEG